MFSRYNPITALSQARSPVFKTQPISKRAGAPLNWWKPQAATVATPNFSGSSQAAAKTLSSQATADADAHGVSMRNKALIGILASLLGGGAIGATTAALSNNSDRKKRQIPTSTEHLDFALPYPQKTAAGTNWRGHGADVGTLKWLTTPSYANTVADVPWFLAPAVLGGTASMLGANDLVSKWYHNRRKKELDKNLQESASNFQNTLMGQYKPENIHQLKQSSVNETQDPLDAVFDKLAYQRSGPADYAGMAIGGGTTLAGLLAYLSAKGAYSISEGRTKEDLLRKALQHKAYLSSLRSPTPISFQTTPAPTTSEDQPDKKPNSIEVGN